MFITTANTLDTIPGPLRDRMEVIQLAGYTEEEKLQIAKRYLVPRQIERNGLKSSQIAFTDTRAEARSSPTTRARPGVRNLEREIGAVCRKVARQVAEGTLERKLTVTAPKVRELLGRPRFQREVQRRTREPGVATGLAWTPVGGDVLFVEATAMPGNSAQAAADRHRPARRRDARVGAGGAVLRARARRASCAPDLAEDWFATTTSTSTCRRARSRRTDRAPASRWRPR